MAGQATAIPVCRPHGKRSTQARIWKPGRRRQPSGARERWKPEWGETPQAARCAARQRDRPCFLAGDARISRLDEHHTLDGPHAQSIEELPVLLKLRLVYGRSGAAGSAVFEGRQACAAGIAHRAFPWRQAKRSGRRLDSETGIHGEEEFSR